jgi:hypothetical protein
LYLGKPQGELNCKSLRLKRQAFNDPKAHHDATIRYLLSEIAFRTEHAIDLAEMTQRLKVFKRVTQGWSVVIGSWFDIYSDFVINNRSLGNFGTYPNIYAYGGKGFYGIGFGFPLLLGLPDDKLKCSSADFLETLAKYKLTNGLNDLLASSLPISAIKSIVSEFDVMARLKLACILDFESDIKEAASLGFLLDKLNTAMDLRIDLEESERKKTSTTRNDDNDYRYDYELNSVDLI